MSYVHNGNTIDESIDKVMVISNDSKYAIREEIYNYANKYFIDGIPTIPIDHLYNNLVRKFRGPLNRNGDNGIINPGNRFYAISLEYIHVGLWDYQNNKMKLIDLENGANIKNRAKSRTKFMSIR